MKKEEALCAIFGAFNWLVELGPKSRSVEMLDGYPVVRVSGPRDVFLDYQTLEPTDGGPLVVFDPITRETFYDRYESVKELLENPLYVGFTYHEYGVGDKVPQEKELEKLFRARYGEARLHHVSSEWHGSIKEAVTNLIATRYFMLKGYTVQPDIGQGPDVVALKLPLAEELVDHGFLRRGGCTWDLVMARNLGRVRETHSEPQEEEIIAIETESYNPKSGIKQLRKGYSNAASPSVEFFDRKVLATPAYEGVLEDIDVLTYDSEGIHYTPASGSRKALDDYWKRKKKGFISSLERSWTQLLLTNFKVEEMLSLVGNGDLTLYRLLERMPDVPTAKVITKLEELVPKA